MPLKTLDYLWVLAQGLLFLAYLLVPQWEIAAVLNTSISRILSGLMMGIGSFLILGAMAQMGRILSPFPKPKAQAQLIRNGVFALMRHPIYTGLFLAALGYALYSNQAWRLVGAFLILMFFYFKSSYEEQNLKAYFLDYEEYAAQTGRFFPKF